MSGSSRLADLIETHRSRYETVVERIPFGDHLHPLFDPANGDQIVSEVLDAEKDARLALLRYTPRSMREVAQKMSYIVSSVTILEDLHFNDEEVDLLIDSMVGEAA